MNVLARPTPSPRSHAGHPTTAAAADPRRADLDRRLAACGVDATTLTAADRQALDHDGFVVFPDAIDPTTLEAWQHRFEEVWELETATAPEPVPTGTRHVDLLVDGAAMVRAVAHPRLLAAVHHVLGRRGRLTAIGGRDPRPGFGAQGLHQDWTRRLVGEPPAVVTALWLLDGFTATSGATRVVPGTHTRPGPPPRAQQSPTAHHPDEQLVMAPAGALVVFDGHLWHSGTGNRSARRRRVVGLTFVAAELVRPHTAPTLPECWPNALRQLVGTGSRVAPTDVKS